MKQNMFSKMVLMQVYLDIITHNKEEYMFKQMMKPWLVLKEPLLEHVT
jgi:hypothetical protein